MFFRKKLIPAALIIVLFSCFARSEGLKKNDIPGLMNRFLYSHVQHHELNEELAKRTIDNLILTLDYGKNYFYKTDVEKIETYGPKLNVYLQNGQYDFLSAVFALYKQRFSEIMEMADTLIDSKHDFNVDEKILLDSEKIEWAGGQKEMKERWRKNIKLQLLNYVSSGQTLDQSRSKLKKKYTLVKKRVEEYDDAKMVSAFMNSFSMALDPHSNYLSQEEHEDFKISMELKLEGIGVRLKSEDGFSIVDSIIPGGAADKLPEELKLKPNDKITAVAQNNGEPVDVIDMDLRDVVNKIRGKKGTEVRLTVFRNTDDKTGKAKRIIIPIVREEIMLQDSEAKSEVYLYEKNGNSFKIGYLRLPSFYMDQSTGKSSSGDVKNHLISLNKSGVKAIVLDLRGNPGGLLNESIDIAGLFIQKGPIVQIKDGTNPPRILNDEDPSVDYSGPLVILVDKFSASASEILAGAMKDYQRAIIIGPSNTYGKGTVQSYNELPYKKGAMKVTTHIFYQPGGTSNQLYGVIPDITVPDITSAWDIGENKTRHPLKWKRINSANYQKFNALSNPHIISSLQGKSKNRITADTEYRQHIKKIDTLSAQMKNKYISLKEESAIEKERKKEIEKMNNNDNKKLLIDLKNDIFLKETFNITVDYILMLTN